ncbi:MAG: SdpI family protein [Marinicella pacifica]
MRHKNLIISTLLIILITWITAFIYSGYLPDPVPTHWNIDGEIDGWTAKPWGVYVLPVIDTATILLLLVLPKIAPKGFRLEGALKVYYLLTLVIAVFMLMIMLFMFSAALNKGFNMNTWIMAGVGLLFIIIGNYLTKIPKNFFLGIRTPWTLSSDKVWYKTHRVSAWVFILAGLAMMLSPFTPYQKIILTTAIITTAAIPILYSLYVYKKVEGFKETED